MGIAMVAGSDFVEMADRSTPPQVIVNEEFVRRYVAPADPIGRQLRSGDTRLHDCRRGEELDLRDVRRAADAGVLLFVSRSPALARARFTCAPSPGSETLLASEVQRAVREIDASLPVYNIRTMAEHVERNLFLRKIPARMFAVIAPLLLALVAIGIYAVVSYTVVAAHHRDRRAHRPGRHGRTRGPSDREGRPDRGGCGDVPGAASSP